MDHLDETTLAAYLKGTLPPAEVTEVDVHLAGCQDCARLVDNWRILYKDMGRLAPDRDSDPHAAMPTSDDPGQNVLFPVGKSGETEARRRPGWSGWLWAVGALTVVLLAGSVVALKMGVGRHQQRNANTALDVLEGMRPAPVAPNRAPADSAATRDTTTITPTTDRADDRAEDPDPGAARTPPATDSAAPAGDPAPAAPAPTTTMPEFERVSPVEAKRRYGGPLRWIDGIPIDHHEVGPGGSVPGSSPATEVVRIVGAVAGVAGNVLLDQQRDPGITGGVALGLGDTLITTADNGITVAMWRPSAAERLTLAAPLSRDELMALVRRVR